MLVMLLTLRGNCRERLSASWLRDLDGTWGCPKIVTYQQNPTLLFHLSIFDVWLLYVFPSAPLFPSAPQIFVVSKVNYNPLLLIFKPKGFQMFPSFAQISLTFFPDFSHDNNPLPMIYNN